MTRSSAGRLVFRHFKPAVSATAAGLGGAGTLADRDKLCRPKPARAREVENNRSSTPSVDPPRFISRLVHCSDGSPRLPAWREIVLLFDSHRVNNRTRSCDRYSDSRCQTVVFRSSGASLKVFAVGLLSNTVGLRGRNSVAENVRLSMSVGALRESKGAISAGAGGNDRRKPPMP